MNPLFLRSPLFDTAGDAGAGGGAGGSGSANAGGADAAASGAQQPVTLEAVKQLINQTVSGSSARLTGEFTKSVNELKTLFEGLKPKPDDSASSSNQGVTQSQSGTQQKTPEVLRLERTLAEQQARLEATEKRSIETEKARQTTEENARKIAADSKLNSALTGIEFLDGMGQDAFNLIRPHLKYNDDGQVVAGDAQLPVEQFVKDWLKTRPNYLRMKDVGGSGGAVRGGSSAGSGKTVDFDKIGPKLSKEERDIAWAEASRLLKQ